MLVLQLSGKGVCAGSLASVRYLPRGCSFNFDESLRSLVGNENLDKALYGVCAARVALTFANRTI